MTEAHAQPPEGAQSQGGGVSRWTLAGLARAAIMAGISVGIGAGLGYLIAHEPAPQRGGVEPVKRPAAGPAELALLAPLGPGSALVDFEVAEIHAVGDEGTLRVLCERGEAIVALDVGLVAEAGPTPPATAGRYAIFYNTLRGATPKEGERLAMALAAILEQNATAPTPPGMAPYTPKISPMPR
jgi:hypothetical protein